MAAIEITAARKSYGAVDVLHGIDLSIADGEFIVLVGPSGCGKSTLLRMIAGLEDITSGTISIGGEIVNDLAPKDRDIAMVFQSYALYPHMNVADNMSYSLRLKKTPKEKIAEAIRNTSHILGLDPLLARRPKALSGGQRQRVAMGRAIVRRPKAFLFDEPLSNLDARLREQMRTEIRKLHRNLGATSVYVTHDQIEAMTMADRIVAMHEGVVQQVGDPLTIYDSPANVFVAGFIGSPAMNFLTGAIALRGGRCLVVTPGGCEIPAPALPELADGQKIILGARPENLVIAGGSSADAISATIDLIEPMGLSTLVHLTIGQDKAPQDTLKLFTLTRPRGEIGSRIGIRFDQDKIHLFDPATGRRLLPPAPGGEPVAR